MTRQKYYINKILINTGEISKYIKSLKWRIQFLCANITNDGGPYLSLHEVNLHRAILSMILFNASGSVVKEKY